MPPERPAALAPSVVSAVVLAVVLAVSPAIAPAAAAGPGGAARAPAPAPARDTPLPPVAPRLSPTGWTAPVVGRVVALRPFAPGPHRWSPGHRGVDLALPPGGVVLAAGAGRVVFAGPVAGRPVVSVSHGVLRTTYEPVVPSVRAGDVVAAGQPLGVLAPGHAPCGGCLHWGLRRGGDYLDPLRLLRPARVRLLPLPRS